MNPFTSQLSQLFFDKDGFGIKLPTKIDMPLNKESNSPGTPYFGHLATTKQRYF